MLCAGQMVKDYEIIAPLRSGGMALLYLARRRGVGGFNRLVVLKLVHPDLVEDAAMTSLFLAEARISAHVAHPNVVHVEEVGRVGGTYFIAMEYVHGVSLSELLLSLGERRQRMSPKLCVWVAAQIAEALHAVHEARGENDLPLHIVHRDVSPQNVLIGHTGHVKLIDFGIAKSQPSDDPTGHGRAVLGKLGYMAPEQLRLEKVDRRTDVYALGVLLWEMLTARSLFRCLRVDDERDWAVREAPPTPSDFSTAKHPALDRVLLKAISLDPADRYESAFAFRAALLRAEPSTVQVDAPRFAALMHNLIGDELARRRASLPSEISVQLEVDVAVTTAKALSIEELTAEIVCVDDQRDARALGVGVGVGDAPARIPRDAEAGSAGVAQADSADDDEGAEDEDHDATEDVTTHWTDFGLAAEAERDMTRADSPMALRVEGALGLVVARPPSEPPTARGRILYDRSSLARPGASASWTEPGTAIVLHGALSALPAANIPRSLEPSVIFTSLEAHIITEPSPRSEASPPGLLHRAARSRTVRNALIGSLCLVFGVLLGTFLRPVDDSASARSVAAPAAQHTVRIRSTARLEDSSTELTARVGRMGSLADGGSARRQASLRRERPLASHAARKSAARRERHDKRASERGAQASDHTAHLRPEAPPRSSKVAHASKAKGSARAKAKSGR